MLKPDILVDWHYIVPNNRQLTISATASTFRLGSQNLFMGNFIGSNNFSGLYTTSIHIHFADKTVYVNQNLHALRCMYNIHPL